MIASGGAPAAAPDLPTVPRSERVLPPLVIAPSTTASPLEKPPGEGAPSSAGPARASGSAGPEDNVGVARESLTADEKKAQDEFFAKLKKLGDTADKLSSYYSDAKTALAVAHSLAEALGLADPVGFSTDTKAILAALDTIAGGINWSQSKAYVDDNMSWTFSAFSAAKRAPWSATAGSGIDLDSNKAVLALAADNGSIAFYRNYNKNINETGRDWPNATSERPEVNNNMVYDYRMGLAPMLESIAIRLQIIAAMDNNFLLDHAFDADLTHYLSVLQWHLQNMKDGIK